ncbi:unnamed protein product [marine sediment metagenome]|uniref:HTH cro/C1-type domain-containing protein n=1 Tax=marine sediment metagenome TaxID=412755 RepID=X1FFD9_9ZZZZ
MRLAKKLVSKIKELRAANNFMTQQDLADAIGVSRQTVSYLEKGDYNPSLKIAHDIAKYFGKSIDDIFEYESVMKIKREEFNLTQEQLATLIGVTVEQIKKIENEEFKEEDKPPEFIEKIAKQLKCKLEDLIEFDKK